MFPVGVLPKFVWANKRLNTAYVLKESFGQLWGYEREGWARRFFENRRASLKWQRLKPYEEFAEMIDRHWDGIAAYCRLENKVSLGFVEGHPLLAGRRQDAVGGAQRKTRCGRQTQLCQWKLFAGGRRAFSSGFLMKR